MFIIYFSKKKKNVHSHKIKSHRFRLLILKEYLNEQWEIKRIKKKKKKFTCFWEFFSQIQFGKADNFYSHKPTNKRMELKISCLTLKSKNKNVNRILSIKWKEYTFSCSLSFWKNHKIKSLYFIFRRDTIYVMSLSRKKK